MNVAREPLAPGKAGLRQTLMRLTAEVRRGARDPEVRRKALRIVRHVPPHEVTKEIVAVYEYLVGLEGFPYRFDPVDVESIEGANADTIGGDCDDYTTQAAQLLEALGHQTRLVLGARTAPVGGAFPRFHHIWLEVYDRQARKWRSFDPVLHRPSRGKLGRVDQQAQFAVLGRLPVMQRAQRSRARSRASFGYSEAGGFGYSEYEAGGLGYTEGLGFFKAIKKLGRKLDPTRGGVFKTVGLAVATGGASLIPRAIGVAKKATGIQVNSRQIINTARAIGREIDPTNSKKIGGVIVRNILQNVPGGGSALTAMDTAANARKMITSVTGVDPASLTRGANVADTIKNMATGTIKTAMSNPGAVLQAVAAIPGGGNAASQLSQIAQTLKDKAAPAIQAVQLAQNVAGQFGVKLPSVEQAAGAALNAAGIKLPGGLRLPALPGKTQPASTQPVVMSAAIVPSPAGAVAIGPQVPTATNEAPATAQGGMSTGAKVGIAVGGAAALGLAAWGVSRAVGGKKARRKGRR